jgi:uncharacterized oxidoreductase
MKITGNTVLVAGGTSGIGRALAVALHVRGNRIIVAGRRQHLLDEIMAAYPGVAARRLDLGDPNSIFRLVSEVRRDFPGLNVVIANAGISQPEDVTSDDWTVSAAEAMVETNIMGVIRLMGAFLPVLRQKPNSTIIATTSNLAFVPRANFPTYCASKAFLHSWLQSLRHQLRKVPVEVLELSPPYVQTELINSKQATDPRAMPLDAYVGEVIQLLERQCHPRGEVLVERDRDRRWAERDGRYDAIFGAINPD